MSKSISFCTTCRNRLWQLKETLAKNLASISDQHEIILVDYGSSDGLSEWVWTNFKGSIENKKLVFFEVKNEVRWNVARAKNLAHRLATGSYLFNLDADNFITLRDIQEIEKVAENQLHCWQFSQGNRDDGSFGRIGLPADLFTQVGGYDETFLAMGYQDIDLLNRLVGLKQKRAHLSAPLTPAIGNTADEKAAESKAPNIRFSDPVTALRAMDQLNEQIARFKLETEGSARTGGGFSYHGLLNGETVTIDGFYTARKVGDRPLHKYQTTEPVLRDKRFSKDLVSFCTTCRNRLWQLKTTLPANLESVGGRHEIVLVDYGSTDGLSEWVWKELSGYIETRKLVFFEVKNNVCWNISRAKNLAHRLASGGYLFNIDADNLINNLDINLIEQYAKLDIVSHQWSGIWEDGSSGRIGVPTSVFHEVGGYDETLVGMGGEDLDLLQRLKATQEKMANLGAPKSTAIKNSMIDKVKEIAGNVSSNDQAAKVYEAVNKLNLNLSKFKLQTEGPIRLGGGFSYQGLLNGKFVNINGFDQFWV